MADIKPFVCVRPAEDVVSAVAALPYDVYNREEAKEVVAKNPKSFLAIDRAETQFPDDVDTYDDRVYAKAAQMLKDWIADGTFIRDNRECYYIYELTMDGRTQTGIAACASIDDYANQVIKKHENTRADKEQDRIRHVDTCSAQTGPIFLAYRANAVINEVVAKTKKQDALYDFVAEDGIRHRVFVISDPEDIKTIRNAFAQIGEIYIADGHHRAASAVKVGFKRREEHPGYTGKEEFNYFLSVLFPDEELIYWIMSIRAREMVFGVLRACGMHKGEIFKMLFMEQFFSGVCAVFAGIGIGKMTSAMFVPMLQRTYAAANQILPMRIISDAGDQMRLYGGILSAMLICLVVLTVLVFRLNITKALKLGEE